MCTQLKLPPLGELVNKWCCVYHLEHSEINVSDAKVTKQHRSSLMNFLNYKKKVEP